MASVRTALDLFDHAIHAFISLDLSRTTGGAKVLMINNKSVIQQNKTLDKVEFVVRHYLKLKVPLGPGLVFDTGGIFVAAKKEANELVTGRLPTRWTHAGQIGSHFSILSLFVASGRNKGTGGRQNREIVSGELHCDIVARMIGRYLFAAKNDVEKYRKLLRHLIVNC